MAATMKMLWKRFTGDSERADCEFSVFETGLTAEQCEVEVMSCGDVVSIEKYDRIKDIERQCMELVVDLSSEYQLRLVRTSSGAAYIDQATFNELYTVVSLYVNHAKNFEVYLGDAELLVAFHHDFTILVYTIRSNEIERVCEVFRRNRFHELR
jgi:hypothetical protein